jgi:hypothetical protein
MNAKGVRRALERRGRFETGWTDLSRLGKLGDWMSLLGARSLQARLSREDPAKRNVFFDPEALEVMGQDYDLAILKITIRKKTRLSRGKRSPRRPSPPQPTASAVSSNWSKPGSMPLLPVPSIAAHRARPMETPANSLHPEIVSISGCGKIAAKII